MQTAALGSLRRSCSEHGSAAQMPGSGFARSACECKTFRFLDNAIYRSSIFTIKVQTPGRNPRYIAVRGGAGSGQQTSLINPCDIADPGEEPDPDTSPGAAALAAGSGVLMARSNWHVHSLGRGGGVRWNVTFGRVQQLSLPALRALVDDVDMPFPHARENCAVLHL